MEREDLLQSENSHHEIVELGAASIETQGMTGPTTDLQIGFRTGGMSAE